MSEPERFIQIYTSIIRNIIRKPSMLLFAFIFVSIYFTVAFFFVFRLKHETVDSNVNIKEIFATEVLKVLTVEDDPGKNSEKDDTEKLSEKVLIIYNSYDRKANGKLTEYGLVSLLEDTYAIYSKGKMDEKQTDTIIALIAKQKEKDPYYGLRFEQEVIIKRLEECVKVATESESPSFIEEIKEIVRRQNVEIEELKKNNSLGIPIGLAGVILTAVFGLLGLSYPLIRSKFRDNLTS